MKKLIPILLTALLVGCNTSPDVKKATSIPLNPPETAEPGYFRLSKQAHYYADISSVWADSASRHLVHFDAVINLTKGLYAFDDPSIFAKSMRQSKVVNCNNYQLTQAGTDYYSEFWGKGLRAPAKKQRQRTIRLRPGSSLYTLSEVLCVNVLR